MQAVTTIVWTKPSRFSKFTELMLTARWLFASSCGGDTCWHFSRSFPLAWWASRPAPPHIIGRGRCRPLTIPSG